MDNTLFETRLRALWARGFTPQTISDSLDVTVEEVWGVVTRLELRPVPKLTMDEALEEMGLSESYRAYVVRDMRRRRTEAAPAADRGRWGEYLKGEAESTQEKNKIIRLVEGDRNSLREGFNF
ncbi:MAG: hypothetical protein L0Y56_11865 [Nitrospira sp.]|nr:hypothetical protein [Nitrospira sp.]